MAKPSKLLETVGYAIASKTLETFLEAKGVEVQISKFNPPIGGVCKKATVTVSKARS
jgi:dihydroneopterin aldolase